MQRDRNHHPPLSFSYLSSLSLSPLHTHADLDHTADVQLHAWGNTLGEAFANSALAMFNVMTPISAVKVDPGMTR